MTDQRAEWAALADAATPGEWSTAGVGRHDIVREHNGGSPLAVTTASGRSEADAAFIAAARTAVPALLAEVAKLDAIRARALGLHANDSDVKLAHDILAILDRP